MKLLFTNDWLRKKIESDPDLPCEAGAPPRLTDATCRRCQFYEASDSTCRFNPPVRLPRKFSEEATAGNRVREEALIWGWPVIDRYDWCGHWSSALSLQEGKSDG